MDALVRGLGGRSGSNQRRRPARTRRRAYRTSLFVERLDSRLLLSAVIHEVPTSSGFNPEAEIAVGLDGALWFSEGFDFKIGRLDVFTGKIREFPIPLQGPIDFRPYGPLDMAASPDGAVWFTTKNYIGRLATDGTFSQFPVPGALLIESSIVAGIHGELWITSAMRPVLARLSPDGTVALFPVSSPQGPATVGADGSVYFAEFGGIGRVTMDGKVSRFDVGAGAADITSIVSEPDGDIWFADAGNRDIGRLAPDGTLATYPVNSPQYVPISIVSGPDGNLWFTEPKSNQVARITPDGLITEFPLPTPSSWPVQIVAGSDGNLWFVEWPFKVVPGSDGRTVNFVSETSRLGELVIDHSISAQAADVQGVQGQAWSGVVADFTSSEPGRAPGDFAASIHWRDGTQSVGSIAPDGHGGFQVTASHTSASAGAGNFTVEVIAKQGTASAFALGNETYVDDSSVRIVTAEVPSLGRRGGASLAPVVAVASGSAGSPFAASAAGLIRHPRGALPLSSHATAATIHPAGPVPLSRAFHHATQSAPHVVERTRAIGKTTGQAHRPSTLVGRRLSSTHSHHR